MNINEQHFNDIIKTLKIKDKYTKDEILIDELVIDKLDDIEIYYIPRDEYINCKAKVLIVGITPGFQQMSNIISMARKEFEVNSSIEDVNYKCKKAGIFTNSLKKNLTSMLDELGLNTALGIRSTAELFEDKDYLINSLALISYPIFVKKKNYTGHTPNLLKNNFLMRYVNETFLCEIKDMEKSLIIPLGRAVEEVLKFLVEKDVINSNAVLWGFPHPSGANVNRLKQFEENKENMINSIKIKLYDLN